jgi:acyl dehydratase
MPAGALGGTVKPLDSWNELSVGQRFGFGRIAMEREAILEYARRWDPQPFHVDEAAAQASIFGGLIASGLHTQAAMFSAIVRTGWVERVSLGGTEQTARWHAPVRPGDEIDIAGLVEELIPSRSRPDRGVVRMRYTGTRVSDGVLVIELLGTHFFRR